MVCSVFLSAKHPVEHFQLNPLLAGGVGVTKQVRLRSDPTRYPIVLLVPSTVVPGGLGTMLIEYGTVDYRIKMSHSYVLRKGALRMQYMQYILYSCHII